MIWAWGSWPPACLILFLSLPELTLLSLRWPRSNCAVNPELRLAQKVLPERGMASRCPVERKPESWSPGWL